MHGTRCFKCGGKGVVLSKRGAEAKRFFMESFVKLNSEIKPGDKIFEEFNGKRCWITVKDIKDDKLNGPDSIKIITDKFTLCDDKNSTSYIITSSEEWKEKHKAAIDYQSKLTKSGKLMKKFQ